MTCEFALDGTLNVRPRPVHSTQALQPSVHNWGMWLHLMPAERHPHGSLFATIGRHPDPYEANLGLAWPFLNGPSIH
jgi:hypothetical protein